MAYNEHGLEVSVDVKSTATFTFSDKPNEGSWIKLIDSAGTEATFEIDNESDGTSGSNIAVNGISGAGGGATGTAADLVAKINAHNFEMTATNPSTGKVIVTQTSSGPGGDTAIAVNNSSHWDSVCSVNVPSKLDGGQVSDEFRLRSTVEKTGAPHDDQAGDFTLNHYKNITATYKHRSIPQVPFSRAMVPVRDPRVVAAPLTSDNDVI